MQWGVGVVVVMGNKQQGVFGQQVDEQKQIQKGIVKGKKRATRHRQ